MKASVPQIRIISVDHERTSATETLLRHAMTRRDLHHCPLRAVYCHLEAGRCGVRSGSVALEVDGSIVWAGAQLTETMAETFCDGLERYMNSADTP